MHSLFETRRRLLEAFPSLDGKYSVEFVHPQPEEQLYPPDLLRAVQEEAPEVAPFENSQDCSIAEAEIIRLGSL